MNTDTSGKKSNGTKSGTFVGKMMDQKAQTCGTVFKYFMQVYVDHEFFLLLETRGELITAVNCIYKVFSDFTFVQRN